LEISCGEDKFKQSWQNDHHIGQVEHPLEQAPKRNQKPCFEMLDFIDWHLQFHCLLLGTMLWKHAHALSQSIQELCPFCKKNKCFDCVAIETSRREFVVSLLMVKIKVCIIRKPCLLDCYFFNIEGFENYKDACKLFGKFFDCQSKNFLHL
jgi:hypothetical protein